MGAPAPESIEAVRRFNRFYTRHIGVLQEGMLQSPWSLAEVRVLYELAHRDRSTATDLGRELGFDPGYLSRILRRFTERRWLARSRSERDGRAQHLVLTRAGRRVFAALDARSSAQVEALLAPLPVAVQHRLVGAMNAIAETLADRDARPAPVTLRPHAPGDLGWVIGRHGALYAQEYGWNAGFEAFVAQIGAAFLRRFDPAREACWIAEIDGERVGSVFCVRQSATVAKLRLLLVEPHARGRGVGRRLVATCIAFARERGYRKLVLWTNDCLHAARQIYIAEGFRLVSEEPHRSFGHDLVGQYWSLRLAGPNRPDTAGRIR